jgi:hypothetical protein
MKIIEAVIDQNASEPRLDTDDLLSDIEISINDVISDVIGESAFVLEANGEKKDVDIAKLKKALLGDVRQLIRDYARDPVASHAEPTHLAKIGNFDSIARQLDLNGWLTGQVVKIVREEEFAVLQQKADAYDKLRAAFITDIENVIGSIDDAAHAVRLVREEFARA